jgi:hypothetical protein
MRRRRCSEREWRRRMGELAIAVAVGSAAAVCLVAVIVMYGRSDPWFAALSAFLIIGWLFALVELDRELDPSDPPAPRCHWCGGPDACSSPDDPLLRLVDDPLTVPLCAQCESVMFKPWVTR